MKSLLFIIILSLTTILVKGQNTTDNDAYSLINRNKVTLQLTDTEIANSRISSSYFNSTTGITMVYLQQQLQDIDVYNSLRVLAFKNDFAVSNTGEFVKNIDQIANNPLPSYTASQAITKILADKNLTSTQAINPISITNNGKKVVFTDLGLCYENIEAELVWLPISSKNVKLCWQIKFVPKQSSDYWMIRMDAHQNVELDKNNLTVYCNWKHSENAQVCNDNIKSAHFHKPQLSNPIPLNITHQSPSTINGATYRVVPYPFESPQHMTSPFYGDRTNPWDAAGTTNNAVTLRWHSTAATTDFNFTRGNNVWAQEDRDNSNTTFGRADTSTTPEPYTFTRTPDYTQEPTTNINQKFNITNLFYWNNIIHDLSYLYGFNEVAGNFQENNLGRGGAGADYVIADAQDAGGTDNANFSTPVDGSRPRMQMYLWSAPTPDRDGDVDNGIVVHEYGHGISNRFTGGPANTSCLGNQEQMGEGWSDYIGLMYTTNWATATVNDGTIARGIGTYALNQPVTGVGIRTYPYTTNMAVNPFTYTNISTVAVPHGVGSVWCTMLWDMTWNMIALDGINPNLYNPTATGGNSAALRLVFEGMRLQPCSPGFVDGRNAILRADTLLYAGRYSCAIWRAFARRGLGVFASQGLSTSRSDQTVDFTDKEYSFSFTQNVNQQNEGNNIVYTTNLSSICTPISNHFLTDTLPNNVTYISGGTYNATNRTVRFDNINLASGQNQNFSFTVRLNNGSYTPPNNIFQDSVNSSTISAIWTPTAVTGTNNWTTSTVALNTGAQSLFVANPTTASEQILVSTTAFLVPNNNTQLSFRHNYNTESAYDGGVVEISTNNGSTWTDLLPFITQGTYNVTMNSAALVIPNRRAFSGNSGGFVTTLINLSSFAGQSIRIRFRFVSDASVAVTGWYIDDVVIRNEATVVIKNNLFNSSNVRINSNTLSAFILPQILPVQLLSFAGLKNGNNVDVNWKTANERDNKVFEIERSINGMLFEKVGSINAQSPLTNNNYQFIDVNATFINAPYLYYRLKQKDINGTFNYTKIIKVNLTGRLQLSILPNPASNFLNVFGFIDNKNYQANIVDIFGKTVFTRIISTTNNEINIETLPSGTYYLKITNNSFNETLRFIKN